MKKSSCLALALAAALSGCGGAQIKQLQTEKASCERGADDLRGQLKQREDSIAGLLTQVKDLEAQAADMDAKLKTQQEQIDSLNKSNKDLKSSMTANTGELSSKVAEVVQEKDALARRLDALQKEKIAAQRAQVNLKAARDRLSNELASAKAKLEETAAAASTAQAAKDKTALERSARLTKAHEDLGSLADAVLNELKAETAKLQQDGESIVLTLREPLLFKPQQAKLTDNGVSLLDRLGRSLQALGPRPIRIEGHSDNSAIKWEFFGSFTSHWDLSSARATTVARYLHEHSGLDPRSITPMGLGEFRPLQGNDTPEGREANRRLVLIIGPAGQTP